jgi:ribosomal protein S18 acetylase RimI-like enzyme
VLVVSGASFPSVSQWQEPSRKRGTAINTDGQNHDEKDLGSIEVGPLGTSDVKDALAVLARGMQNNPNHVAVFGEDPAIRVARLGVLFERVNALAGWQALAARDPKRGMVGVMMMLRPGTCRHSPLEQLRSAPGPHPDDPKVAAAIVQWLQAWRERDPEERHWHFGPFAVEAHLQGRGVGSELMRVVCAQMDAGRENAYLETDIRKSVGFCERFGFEVVGEQTVLGAPNWFMMRRPRGGVDVSEEGMST